LEESQNSQKEKISKVIRERDTLKEVLSQNTVEMEKLKSQLENTKKVLLETKEEWVEKFSNEQIRSKEAISKNSQLELDLNKEKKKSETERDKREIIEKELEGIIL
jgi:hypothetical protein